MKAFTVRNEEGQVTSVFAKNSQQARRLGATILDEEFESVSAQRAPEFDQYASEKKIPIIAKLAQGWFFECQHCQRQISVEDMLDNLWEWEQGCGTEAPISLTLKGGLLYCCADCAHEDTTKRRTRHQQRQDHFQEIQNRFPGTTVTEYYQSAAPNQPFFAVLRVPGTPVTFRWEIGSDNVTLRSDWAETYRTYRRFQRMLPKNVAADECHNPHP